VNRTSLNSVVRASYVFRRPAGQSNPMGKQQPVEGMTYYSVPIFIHGRATGVPTYQPTGPVDCYVVRAALFGSPQLGARGIYHSGILCVGDSKEWAFELTLDDFSNLIPVVVGGAVELNNQITLGYYPPIDAHMWRPYWTVKSHHVCRLTPAQHGAMVGYIVGTYGPQFPRYVPFGIADKPTMDFWPADPLVEDQRTRVYTVDNTCDKLGMRVFEWLHSNLQVAITPFPVTRAVLQTPARPQLVAPNDPGLVAHARAMQTLRAEYGAIKRHDYVALLRLLWASKPSPVFRYVLSLDAVTGAQSYYLLPTHDVSTIIEDVWIRVGRPTDTHPRRPASPTHGRVMGGTDRASGSGGGGSGATPLTIALGSVLGVVWFVLVVAAWWMFGKIPGAAPQRPLALGLGAAGMVVPPLLLGPIVIGSQFSY